MFTTRNLLLCVTTITTVTILVFSSIKMYNNNATDHLVSIVEDIKTNSAVNKETKENKDTDITAPTAKVTQEDLNTLAKLKEQTENKSSKSKKSKKSNKAKISKPNIAYNYKVKGKRYSALSNSKGFTQVGTASWYGGSFHGRKTANGEIYNMNAMTGAHKTLPLVTYAKVINLSNKKTAVIKINDRGPFVGNRILDLSKAAAKKLGLLEKGTAKVEIIAM